VKTELEAPLSTRAIDVLARHADHPSAFLALNRETRHFLVPGIDGLIAYRPCGGWLFQLGPAFAPAADRARLLEAFRAFARRERKRICALQLRAEDVALHRAAGFRVNQLGLSYGLDLARFSLAGSRFMQLRNKVKRARRDGVVVEELGPDAPRDAAAWADLEAITRAWLASKGRGKKLLEFMIGELGEPDDRARRVFVARKDGRAVGFVSYVPAWGARGGFLHDVSRRLPDAPPGVMELVNATAIERFREEGAAHLSFGLTPFVGLSPATDAVPGRSRFVSWLLATLERRGQALYPARSQAAYKLKWEPHHVEPEYFAFEGRFRLSCLVRLLILTRSI
jgi:lysylphosphatidylglycerol synthetase-like protein (DUF2156 family)